MRNILIASVAAALVMMASTASADMPAEPCFGLNVGDPCTTLMGRDGTCVDSGGLVDCVEGGGTGGGATGGNNAGGNAAGSPPADDGDSGDDSGCAIGGSSRGSSAFFALATLLGLAIRRRRG